MKDLLFCFLTFKACVQGIGKTFSCIFLLSFNVIITFAEHFVEGCYQLKVKASHKKAVALSTFLRFKGLKEKFYINSIKYHSFLSAYFHHLNDFKTNLSTFS